MHATKPKRKKRIKIQGPKSAVTLMESLIYQMQKLENSAANMKIMAYLLQTYTAIWKTYREEYEINDIIEYELLNQRSEITIMLNAWRSVLQSKLGDELYSTMQREYAKMEKELNQQVEKSREAIREQIKKKSNYKITNKTSESPAFITETIKSLSILLPEPNKEEILLFIKNHM